MSLKSASARIGGFDLMKVLAMYIIMVYHLTFRNELYILEGYLPDLLEYVALCFMSICVPLFFTVSGSLSLPAPLNLKKSLCRSLQVLLLTVFWLVFSMLWVLLLRRESVSLSRFLFIVSWLEVGYVQHLWFLPNFFFLCLMTPVLQTLRDANRRIYRFFLLVIFVFTFGNALLSDVEYLLRWLLVPGYYYGDREYFWFNNFFDYNYWYVFIYYTLGGFLMEHRETLRRYRKHALCAIPVCVAALLIFGLARSHVTGEVFDPIYYNYDDPFTLLLTVAVFVLMADLKPAGLLAAFSKSIARCSMGIYLVHWLLIEILLVYFPAVTGSNRLAPFTGAGILLLSWGITLLGEKLPLVRNLFTVSPKWVKKA